MAMQQDVDAVLANGRFDGVLVDVGDFLGHRCAVRPAVLPRLAREGDTLVDRLRHHHGLPLRITRHGPHLLVFDVIRAQIVAVAQQHLFAVKIDAVWVGQQAYARLSGEALADHEIPVAVHEIHGHARV